jgi:zinc and cadmium transporter
MFFIERFFAYHHHDISEDEPLDSAQVVATHAEKHPRDHQPHSGGLLSRQLSWTGAAIGLSLHSLADGLALAASIEAEHAGARPVALAGLGTFLVVFLHKPFDAMTLGTLLAAANRPRRVRILINVFFALLVPLGAALCIAGIDTRSDHAGAILGAALAFSAGTFLCIASSDLLPELQFHHHDRGKLSAALLLGIATAWAIGLFEAPGHVHGDNHPPDAHRHEATRPAER